MGREFIDTDILVYALVDDPRSRTAEAVLARRCDTSVQTLNEFANVARRKLAMTWQQTKDALAAIRTLCSAVHPLDLQTHQRALQFAERHGFSRYDALIVAAAYQAGCTVLYSEDMQHGMEIEQRLRICNPFLETA